MVAWHYKRLDALAAISKRYAADSTLDTAERSRFEASYLLANTLKQAKPPLAHGMFELAFGKLCEACKHAKVSHCVEGGGVFDRCQLVVDHYA